MKIDAVVLREINMPLVHPFETSFGVTTQRRIVLVEIESDGVSGWGECVAGEHPYFSEESVDTAWPVLFHELCPLLVGADIDSGISCVARWERVRGNRMAKAALENAVWDLEAQRRELPLSQLLGGTRGVVACGVSIGIQPSLEQLLNVIAKEIAAGYQRIKLKVKPGWDLEVLEAVRARWPRITLSVDANSAYRPQDSQHLAGFDRFKLLMIEQPLWHDDFYFHAALQKQLKTAICLDESVHNHRDAIAAMEMKSCQIINVKVGRVGGFSEAIAVHDAANSRGIPVWCGGMLETGIGRSHNIALSSLSNFSLPGDVSASARYWAEDLIEPEVCVSGTGEIKVPTTPGRGFEVKREFIERRTVRRERITAGNPVTA